MMAHPARWILLAMACGVAGGIVLHGTAPEAVLQAVTAVADTVAALFLRLVRLIVAPLVLATLAGGVAGMRGQAGIGRVALVAMGWFVAASLLSLGLGLLGANLLHPGTGLALPLPRAAPGLGQGLEGRGLSGQGFEGRGFDGWRFVEGLVPTSVVDAMARNDVVQVVVFAALFGMAVSALPEDASARMRTGLSDLGEAMLRLTALVMRLAPLAVFASLLGSFGRGGMAMAGGYARLVGGFYATGLVLWGVLAAAGFAVLGRRAWTLLRMMAPPLLLGFATASSEAAFPQTVAVLERFGMAPRLVGLVLPLGYAFNLDGSMLFQAFAALFIAQAYGIALGPWQQVGMLLVLMATSKGTAGVPRAATVALASVLPAFGLPDAGLLLILGIDHVLDMGRTATSVLGNAVAVAVVGRLVPAQAADEAGGVERHV